MHFTSAVRRLHVRWPVLLCAMVVGCAPAAKLPVSAVTGPSPTIAAPVRSRMPIVNVAKAVGWSGDDHPAAANGTRVAAFARELDHPRWLYVLPNGDVLVAETNAPSRPDDRTGIRSWFLRLFMHEGGAGEPSANRITLLRDADGDGVAETRTVFLSGLNSPFGMALVGGNLYVANTDAVLRFPYALGQTSITAAPQRVTELPAGTINHHWTRGLVASPDGSKLYVSVGSNSDYGERGLEQESARASIWEIDATTGAHRIFASGMRNPVGMAWVPGSSALWTVVNEREELGGDLPPDYMTAVRDGGFYGWPFAYFGQHVDERIKPARPDLVETSITPDYALGAHTASLGLAYAGKTTLPERFSNGMIVTQHGSWNRIPRSGYRVLFVPFSNGTPSGPPTVLLTGFLDHDDNAQGRPSGVAIDARGGVLIADDAGNTIWRVTGTRPYQAVAAPSLLVQFQRAVESAEVAVAQTGAFPRRCVDAMATDSPQSGDFSAGGFSVYAGTWHQGKGRLAFRPLKEVKGPLVLHVTSLDATETLDLPMGELLTNGSYAAPVRLPHAGNWMIETRAGTAWGCFLYSLR